MIYGNKVSHIALEDLKFFKKSGNQSVLKKNRTLLESIQNTPFSGIGKPEALKHEQFGNWSIRINQEHRLIHGVQENLIIVHFLRGHYL